MKKGLLLAIGICISLCTHTSAQVTASHCLADDMYIGPTIGAGSTWVDKMGPRKEFKPGGIIGINFLYASGHNIGWGADLVVSVEGYKRSEVTKEQKVLYTESVTPLYVRLPLRMYYMMNSIHVVRPMIFAGPAFGYKIAEYSEANKVTGSMFLRQNSNSFRNFDVGLSGGAGLLFRFTDKNWMQVSANYYHGVVDAFEPYYRDNQIENISVNIGMLFALH